MATFRFELNGRPTKRQTFVVYLRVTIGGRRKLFKTPVEVANPGEFNASSKDGKWVRESADGADEKNARLAAMMEKARLEYRKMVERRNISVTILEMVLRSKENADKYGFVVREESVQYGAPRHLSKREEAALQLLQNLSSRELENVMNHLLRYSPSTLPN